MQIGTGDVDSADKQERPSTSALFCRAMSLGMASSKRRAVVKAEWRALATAALAAGCTKAVYIDQAAARAGLASLMIKRPINSQMRVYPCDICPAWHLTSKKVGRKKPPWDRDPDWTRPDR